MIRLPYAQGIKKEQFDDQDNEEIPAGVVAFYSCGAGQRAILTLTENVVSSFTISLMPGTVPI